jgi:hypothetical protein
MRVSYCDAMYCCGNKFERARKRSNALPRTSVQSVLVMGEYAHKAPSTKDCDEACKRTTANTTQSDVAETASPLVLTTVRQLLAARDYNPNVPARCKTLVPTTVRQLLATRDYNPNVPARVTRRWSLQPFDIYWRLVIGRTSVTIRWSLQPFDNYWRLVITIPMSQHVGPYNRSTLIGDS